MPASLRNKHKNANKSTSKAKTPPKYQKGPSQKSTELRKIKKRCDSAIWSHDSLTMHAEELERTPTSGGFETNVLEVAGDRESSPEVLEEPAVKYFSLALHSAQREVSVAEGSKKRVHSSHGKSARSIRRHKQARRAMEAQGFLSLPDFFKHKAEKAKQREASDVSTVTATAPENVPAASAACEDVFKASMGSRQSTADVDAFEVSVGPSRSTAGVDAFKVSIGSTPSVDALDESPRESAASAVAVEDDNNASKMASAVLAVREEEEEEEEEASATCTVTSPARQSSSSDLSDIEKASWGPQRTILYESEESSSSSDTPSDSEDLRVTNSQELKGHRLRHVPDDPALQPPVDSASKLLRDHEGLRAIQRELSLMARQKIVDAVLHGRVVAMVGLLNLYLDPSLGYTWTRASEVTAKLEGRGKSRARSTRRWVLEFARTRELPTHNLGRSRLTVLDDEDIVREMKTILSEKARSGFFKATDIVDIVSSPEMQAHFARAGVDKPSISLSTARRWLSKLGWRYGKHRGMYIDGHEREDVVEYRRRFVHRFQEYERRFHSWDNAGNELPRPRGFLVPGAVGRFRLVLITHDESTFYQNDQRQVHWGCPGEGAPKPKGEGASLMVSDFLSPDWGRLRDGDWCVFTAPFPFNRTHTRTAKPGFFSGLGRAGTAGLQLTTCSPRWTARLTYSRGSQTDTPRRFSSSTTHRATRSVQTTRSQLSGW